VRDLFIAVAAYLMALLPGNVDPESLTPWKGYAAFVVSADGRIGMGWSKVRAEAEQKALAACRRKSLMCSDEASVTDRPTDKVALVCCRRPDRGCVIGVADSDQEAISFAEEFTQSQEWGNCSVRAVYSARTGFRQ
jgi:hypothetical protein